MKNPPPGKKNVPNLSVLAEMCQRIYLRGGESSVEFPERYAADLKRLGCSDVRVFDDMDVQCSVCKINKVQVVCFRGTDSPQEILDNFLASLKPDPVIPDVAVHRIWSEDVDYALGVIDCEVGFDAQVTYIVGHSRGGAQAQIAAARLRHMGNKVVCVTFESPRAGNRAFATYLSDRVPHIRVIRSGDIVPLTPLPIRFRHTGRPMLVGSDGRISFTPGKVTRVVEFLRAMFWHVSTFGFAGVKFGNYSLKTLAFHLVTLGFLGLRNHNMGELAKIIDKEESKATGSLLMRFL